MRFLQPCLLILLILSISFLSGCVKGTPNNPKPSINYRLLASGSVNAITSLRDSFQALDVASPGKYQKDIDALNKILVIASPINDELQTTGKTTLQEIEDFARIGAAIAATAGLSPDIVIAINLGIGVFKSIEPFILISGDSSGMVLMAPGVQADPRVKLGQLQALDATYRRQAKR